MDDLTPTPHAQQIAWYEDMADLFGPSDRRRSQRRIRDLDLCLTPDMAARLAAHFGRLALAPKCKAWDVMCPDCDHGVAGGKPCETCAMTGYVMVVLSRD